MKLTIPKGYKPLLDPVQTEKAIKFVKDCVQLNLSAELKLRRVTAPLFVLRGTGINDDLNGIERAVNFPIKEMDGKVAE
jgi:aspartate--ammonia ligase